MEQSIQRKEMWTKASLWRLVWPLMIEQLLLLSIGIIDTIMITPVGEAALSGISLVDAINILIINIFTALATGGTVVVSQYIGRKDSKNASTAAKHLLYSITLIAIGLMAISLLFRRQILDLIYGHIDADVMGNAMTYFWLSAISYPFMAIYNAGAALFRSTGNSKVSMYTSLMVNIINIAGNALLIFGLGWGVAGAATSSLVSRIMAACVVLYLLVHRDAGPISLGNLFHYRRDAEMVKRIFKVGIPSALENSLFQIGKLMVARIISTFGTSAIAGNAIAINLIVFVNVPGMAVSLAMITVAGQCIGAKDFDGAKRNTKRLLLVSHGSMLALGLLLISIGRPLLGLFNLSAEATQTAWQCMLLFCATAWLCWPPSFALPNALRAAGDVRYTMIISLASMWIFRIGAAYLLAYGLGLGVLGVWLAMILDWVIRDFFFMGRWKHGKWQQRKVI